MSAGRPLIIESPQEAEELAQAYFAKCAEEERPITITGLALALGLNSRQALINYENRPEFNDTIKRLKTHVEMGYEERLSGCAATGSIFALKNFGWTDKQELEHTGKDGGPIQVSRIELVALK